MKDKFRQKNGLTTFAMACGYIQKVEAVTGDDRDVSITLHSESACFIVGAHDFTVEGRLERIAENNLGDARLHFDRLVKQYFGDVISKIKKNKDHSVSQEMTEDGPRYVFRIRRLRIAHSDTAAGAWLKGRDLIN